jgi:metal-responsive CopG/Arc/MetJ family transcriptional regulator
MIACMKTVQMTLDEDLIERVDRAARQLNTTRSAFTREALNEALEHITTLEHEAQHRRGYEVAPEGKDEFSDWAAEQVWPE